MEGAKEMQNKRKSSQKNTYNFCDKYRVLFLTVPPNFQYQNEK
jgi:hypothetical protein